MAFSKLYKLGNDIELKYICFMVIKIINNWYMWCKCMLVLVWFCVVSIPNMNKLSFLFYDKCITPVFVFISGMYCRLWWQQTGTNSKYAGKYTDVAICFSSLYATPTWRFGAYYWNDSSRSMLCTKFQDSPINKHTAPVVFAIFGH